MNKSDLPPVVLIAGPTASGKSALAMALAEVLPATIINADSMQVYRDLRVITSRPSLDDERRIPHALFGYIDGGDACSAARWAADAKVAVANIHRDGGLPILVGGTGLYIRTLLDGIAPIPAIGPAVRDEVRGMAASEAYVALQSEDAQAASRLAPGDSARVARALEVVRSTGRTIGAWQAVREGGIAASIALHGHLILPPRDELSRLIDARFARMFDEGQTEVAALVARCLDPMLPVMRAIGVSQIADYVARKTSREDAIAAGRLATRQYAKRQATWFRRQVPRTWTCSTSLIQGAEQAEVVTLIRERLLTTSFGTSTRTASFGERS